MLNNFLRKTLEWGLAWAGVGLKIFVSKTLYGKWNLNIKKCARVHFRDKLAGNYSRDPVFCSHSALHRSHLSKPYSVENQTGGKTVHFLGESPSLTVREAALTSALHFFQHGNYCVKDVGGEDRKGWWATSPESRLPVGYVWQNLQSLWHPVVSAPGSWVLWVQHCWGACSGSVWIPKICYCRIGLNIYGSFTHPVCEWTQRNISSDAETRSQKRKKNYRKNTGKQGNTDNTRIFWDVFKIYLISSQKLLK